MGLGPAAGHPESTGLRAPHHAHAALRAIERRCAAGLVPAVRAGQPGSAADGWQACLLGLAEAVAGCHHLRVERAEQLLADAFGVTTLALAAPSDHGSHDELARQLVPVRGEATDDRVVLRIPARI